MLSQRLPSPSQHRYHEPLTNASRFTSGQALCMTVQLINRANRVHANPALWGLNLVLPFVAQLRSLSGPGESVTVVLGGGTDCEVYMVYLHLPSIHDVDGKLLLIRCLFCSQRAYPIALATSKATYSQCKPIDQHRECNGCNPGITIHAHHMQGAHAQPPSRSSGTSR
jgi:hypothetical protein